MAEKVAGVQKAYRVLTIDEMVRPGKAGGIERFYRHSILTRGEVRITVDIDEDNFTPEKVAPILEKAALNADKILSL